MPKPWPTFRKDALAEVSKVFVTRQPVRKATGAAHEDTIKSLRIDKDTGEKRIVQKVKLQDLTPAMLDRLVDVKIVDNEPVGRNKNLYQVLKQRLDEHDGKPAQAFKAPINMPANKPGQRGPAIHGVKIRAIDKSGVPIPGRNGVAGNETMIRVDVFVLNGQYYLIPVYVHHLANGVLPDRVCKGGRPEDQWPKINDEYEFLFSLHKNDFLVLEKSNTEVLEGYFVKMDRSTASITLRPHDSPDNKKDIRSIGVLNLSRLRKFTISYLGNWSEIKQEKRLGLENRPIAKSNEGES